MAEYRLIFINGKGTIEARQEFRAADDSDAIMLAGLLAEALSDSAAGYELWGGTRCLVSTRDKLGCSHKPLTLDEIGAQAQQNALDFEEMFQRSHWRLAHSQKLLATISSLRERCGATAAPATPPRS